MKNNSFWLLVFGLLIGARLTTAQAVEVPINKKFDGATVLNFLPPYDTLRVYIEDDFDGRYSSLAVTPQTLFLKRSLGSRKLEKLKDEDYIKPTDIRPGMRIDMRTDHYQISLKNRAKEIMLSEKYYRNTAVDGLYEFYDGKKASVDGQLVALNPGVAIKGIGGWSEKKFASFDELQLGCALSLQGKREADGVIYVSRGTAKPVESTSEDRLLRRGVGLGMKIEGNQIVMGSFNRKIQNNDVLADYVNTVGQKIVPAYIRNLPPGHPDHIDFKYYLVEDTTLNASAMADGTVFVHTAMLQKIDSEAQLAAVLGHEIAHVTQQHHAKNLRNRQNWDDISKVLSVGSVLTTGSVMPTLIVSAVSEMYVGKYSRNQETQADRIGLRYMYDAGYDPRESAAIWRKLAEDDMNKALDAKAMMMMMTLNGENKSAVPEQATNPGEEESIYASHPRSRDRFNHVNFLLSTTYANVDMAKTVINRENHRKMVALLTGKKAKPVVNRPDIRPTRPGNGKAGSGKTGTKGRKS